MQFYYELFDAFAIKTSVQSLQNQNCTLLIYTLIQPLTLNQPCIVKGE